METRLTARDLWPLIQRLPPAERLKLLALAGALADLSPAGDAERYGTSPPGGVEFGGGASGLDWEADGWDEFDASP